MPDPGLTMIHFRAISDTDLDFLRELYASTREEEMSVVPWASSEKQAFLAMQFEAQHAFYAEQFPQARFDLVLEDETPIGRLYLDKREDEHRLIDIALLPSHRGRGIGGRLMREVLEQAAADGKAVRIHVERNNPARRLYDRLGFRKIEDQGVYDLLEWRPEVAAAAGENR